MTPIDTIRAFDEFLEVRGLRFDAVVIGGAALNLMGTIDRPTKDLDVMDPAIPFEIRQAASEFAAQNTASGTPLPLDWLNDRAQAVAGNLPKGWQERIQPLYQGQSLKLLGLGRSDLLKTKLDAYTRRNEDLVDLVALRPTADELAEAFDWVVTLEDSEGFPEWLEKRAQRVAKELGYEFRAPDRT